MRIYREQVKEAAHFLQEKVTNCPKIAIILGSGLGELANRLEQPITIKYSSIPFFPTSTVEGHTGQIVFGKLQDVEIMAMQGRFHYYEGYNMRDVTFPIRVMKELGVSTLIVTNAAGGVQLNFEPGDLMLINDHINLMGDHPLIGSNDAEWGPRFPDMSEAYGVHLRSIAKSAAQLLDIPLKEGVYAGMSGPTYETPAEIRMLRNIGADAVGMSTVPEVIVARHMGISVLGLSCITNMAAGILDQPLAHDEVIKTSEQVKTSFIALIETIVKNIN